MGLQRRSGLRIGLAAILALGELATWPLSAHAQRVRATAPGVNGPPIARASSLPPATDLATDAALARRDTLPILLFFDRVGCPYCEQALREYLVPMSRDAWAGRAVFRSIDIDRSLPVTGFDGKPTTHAALASHYGVTLSPTVLVVDATGVALSDPIVGLLTVDFYGAYLDRALEHATARIRRDAISPNPPPS